MSEPIDFHSTASIQNLLNQIRDGDSSSIQKLLDASMDRLRGLAKKISYNIPGVKRWEQTDDLLQNAAIRLWKSLEKNHPQTPLDFYRLASTIIRRELIDLSRHHFGPEGMGANLARSESVGDEPFLSPIDLESDNTNEPGKLGRWTEFHRYVEGLEEEERMLFDLLWYQGLTLDQASEISGVSERTLRRRWKSARVTLYEKLLKP